MDCILCGKQKKSKQVNARDTLKNLDAFNGYVRVLLYGIVFTWDGFDRWGTVNIE